MTIHVPGVASILVSSASLEHGDLTGHMFERSSKSCRHMCLSNIMILQDDNLEDAGVFEEDLQATSRVVLPSKPKVS